MIQIGTTLNVVDNSGAKTVYCIKTHPSTKKFAAIGDIITVVVKDIRKQKRNLKIKKSEITFALVIHSKFTNIKFSNEMVNFHKNSVILLSKKKKLIGNRILGALPTSFRRFKFLRSLSLSNIWI